ncbi:MAG TPA: indolepyruvate oxidoreductase subunit beta [Armatimonadota bacterium]
MKDPVSRIQDSGAAPIPASLPAFSPQPSALDPTSILIVGVGGQGTILAARILSRVALLAGKDVKFSETHGMAQRGGAVVTQVRIGDRIFAPTIDPGTADFILAFEQLEALRWSHMLKPDAAVIMSTQIISPMPVILGTAKYPQGVEKSVSRRGKVFAMDADRLACEAGNARAANVVLLGRLGRELGLPREIWEQALADTVKPKFLESNRRALAAGWEHQI